VSSLPIKIRLTAGHYKITAVVADTPDLRAQGLMRRLSLEENCGMIFVFNDTKNRSFWMKETYLPLSIAYLTESGTIINIEKMTPLDLSSIQSHSPARYALEMNEGWFEKRGIYAGDTIILPDHLLEEGYRMNESLLRSLIRNILAENFVSHSNEPTIGDRVVNNNPKCIHFGSEGTVISLGSLDDDMGKTVEYRCTNTGDNWSSGDVLEKTMDQLTRIS